MQLASANKQRMWLKMRGQCDLICDVWARLTRHADILAFRPQKHAWAFRYWLIGKPHTASTHPKQPQNNTKNRDEKLYSLSFNIKYCSNVWVIRSFKNKLYL